MGLCPRSIDLAELSRRVLVPQASLPIVGRSKFRDQFRRRVENGRCFATPYLGCREFAASFDRPDGTEQPIDRTEDIGPMLLDLEYATVGSGQNTPRFFEARLERGVLRVPILAGTREG